MLRLTLSEVYKENDTLYIGLDKVPNDQDFDQDNDEIIICLGCFCQENLPLFTSESCSF